MPRRLLACLLLTLVACGAAPSAAGAATTAQRLVSIARAELAKGVREVPDGSNRAPAISRYLTATKGAYRGAPWCAYFTSWVARQAGVPIGPGGRGLGYVPTVVQWAKSTKRWRKKPRPGYLVTWPNHIGIVETVSGRTMTTIEGNAGNAVRRRWRRTSDAQGFVALAAGGQLSPAPPKRVTPTRPAKTVPLKARITFYPSARLKVGQRLELSANDSSGDIEKVRWDFDADGKFDDAKGDTASLRVRRAGRFPVSVRVYDASGKHATASSRVTVLSAAQPAPKPPERPSVGTPAPAPAVALACDRPSLPTGQHVQCTADTRGSTVKISRLEWDTDGDGVFGRGGGRVKTSYDRPGARVVTVRAIGRDGSQATAAVTVDVTNRAPSADLRAPGTVRIGAPAWLDASRSSDPDGTVAAIRWDIGGDGVIDGEGARFALAPTTAGALRVVVSVHDDAGAVTTRETTVSVLPELRPVIGVLTPSPAAGEEVQLTARDSTGPVRLKKCQWDFNSDGRVDRTSWDCTETVRVVFASAGTKLVTLTVVDAENAQAAATTEFLVA